MILRIDKYKCIFFYNHLIKIVDPTLHLKGSTKYYKNKSIIYDIDRKELYINNHKLNLSLELKI